jgi:hypothetical protein
LVKSALEGLEAAYKSYYEKVTGHDLSVHNFVQDAKTIFGKEDHDNPALKTLGQAPTGESNAETLGHAIERMEGEYAKGNTPNRPQRNNNPGNIEYGPYAKAHGATSSDGRFAIFPSYDTGHKALIDLLQSPKYADLTVAQAINKYAPSKENDTAGYIRSVTKGTGLSADSRVGSYTRMLNGIPGATSTLNSRFTGTMPSPTGSGPTVNIENLEIHTQAKDAPEIAKSIGDSLKSYLLTSQANLGLQ